MKEHVAVHQQTEKENAITSRKTLKTQFDNKENLIRRSHAVDKDNVKLSSVKDRDYKREEKSCQTGNVCAITIEDLTGDEPSANYWKLLAEARAAQLEDSFNERDRLLELVTALQEDNVNYRVALNESQVLVETLQEILNESQTSNDEAEDSSNCSL